MRRALPVLALALLALGSGPGSAAPARAVHDLDWFVHVDLIDPGAGRDLAYYTALLGERLAEANVLVEGHQGPADAGCCVSLDAVSVSSFGTPGDGLDVIDSAGELSTVFGGAAGAYLVQSVFYCDGFSTSVRGCAQIPGDRFVVSLDAEDTHFLPAVIAHERGHNGGLAHVSSNPCELMAASDGGGCLSVSECQSFIADAHSTAGSCGCLADALGDPPVPLGSSCSDTSGCGLCSGGMCGACTGLAGARLFAAGGAGSGSGLPALDAILQAGLASDWDPIATFAAEIRGLAHDPAGGVLYGAESRAGDDALVTLDPDTGAVLSTVGVLTGREEVIALAWDAQGAGGRLFAIEVDDDFFGQDCLGAVGVAPPCFSDLFEIDPGSAAQTERGELNSLIITGGIQGLAWDDSSGTLYGASPAGLVAIGLASCDGSTCTGATAVDGVFRDPVSLTWEPGTGLLVREGDDGLAHRVDLIDPGSGDTRVRRGIDAWSAGGLAALPVPEPVGPGGLAAGLAALAALGRRRLRRG